MTLNLKDVEWDRGKSGMPVIIGRGAFGTVYAGRLRGEPVAIKSEELGSGQEGAWMTAAGLLYTATCPHIVGVHGIIVDREGSKATHYLVMERLAGTMTELLLAPGGAHYGAAMELRLALLANVAGGLAYLHERSTIHADVKPANVLLSTDTPPTAKLADFGSSVLRREGTKTRGTLVGQRGTLMYMDPCLLDGSASITAASDVYSFGVMAWQVLSGRTLYEAELVTAAHATATEAERLLKAHVCGPHGKRPPVAALVERGVPPAVVALVESCWAPAPASRPAMAAVRRALETAALAMAARERSGAAAPSAASSVAAPVAARAPARPVPVAAGPLVYEWNDSLVLRGYGTYVWSLALLPGGQLASGDSGGRVRLWDAAREVETPAVMEVPVQGGEVTALAALPDGHSLAAGVNAADAKAGAVVVWDMGVVPPTLSANIACDSAVLALAVLRDGRLAAGCVDGRVRLVEVGAGAGAMTATLEGHTSGMAALAVLADGRLASGSWDKRVRLWDVSTRACVAKLEGHTDSVYALAALADGRLASGSSDNSVRLWDVTTRTCVGVLDGHTDWVFALAALPDGRLASGSADNTIRVWDTHPVGAAAAAAATAAAGDAPVVVVLEGHAGTVVALHPLPGGRLASGSRDEKVRLWRLAVPP